MAIRLIALDIDGTLSEARNVVSPRNLEMIREAQRHGIFVTVATGRNYLASKPILNQLAVDGPVILYGGAWIADANNGDTLYCETLSPETVKTVLDFAAEAGVHAQIYQGNTVLYEKENPFAERYCRVHSLPSVVDPQLRRKRHENVPKILAYVDPSIENEVRAALAQKIGNRAGVSRSQPGFIEINAATASKGHALAIVAGRLGILQQETAALGDSYLDMDMIRWAGHGVCVRDGVDEVKAAADIVVPSCSEDGVAYYIAHYALKRA